MIVSSADSWGIFNQRPSTRKGFQNVNIKIIRDASTISPEPIQGHRKETQLSKSKVREWTLCSYRDFCLEGLISMFSVAGAVQSSSFVCHPVMKEGSVTDTDSNRSEPRKNTTPKSWLTTPLPCPELTFVVSEPLPTWVWFQTRPARLPQSRIGSAPRPKPLPLSGDLHSLHPQDPAKDLPVRMFVWLLQWTRIILGREVYFVAVVTAFDL